MSKLLTVFGATGQQGGALINHILTHPKLSKLFHLRGITRDTSKAAAITLQERGVQIIQADLSDPSSLGPAVAGSWAVFAVTNYWDTGSAAIEIAQGRAVADSCIAARVSLLIWSSLPSISAMTKGEITSVHHFDSKAEVERYIRGLPIVSAFFMAGWYMQNHILYMPARMKEDGTAVLKLTWSPTAHVPMIDITDTGKFLVPILLHPSKYNGKNFTCATDFYTPLQLVEEWSEVTGVKVVYEQIEGGEREGNLTEEMQKQLRKSRGLIDEWSYFGPRGREDLGWTLGQLGEGERPNSWGEFLRREGPWFGEGGK